MTDAVQIADRYIAVRNERDPARRHALLADGWTKNATYVDPLAAGEGHEQIGALDRRGPATLSRLSLRTQQLLVYGYGDKIRFSWALGPEHEPDMIKGTDVAFIEGERLKSVIGFLDKVPAGA